MKHPLIAFVAAAVLLPAAGTARAQDSLQLTNAVFQEVETTGADGKKQVRRVPAAKVVPGTEVIYVITYRNTGAKSAEKVVISNPLPPELIYREGSAGGDGSRFEVSVDGGKSFGSLAALRIAGGDGRSRPAQPADVTHLRWILARPVAPGQQGSVSYRAALR